MKIIIAGSRGFRDKALLFKKMDFLLQNTKEEIEIVSGDQVTTDQETGEKYGADYLGKLYAKERGYKLTHYPADWGKYGKAAGPIRNKEMAEYGTHCVAFWDGKSRGTQNMIKLAREHGLRVIVMRFFF